MKRLTDEQIQGVSELLALGVSIRSAGRLHGVGDRVIRYAVQAYDEAINGDGKKSSKRIRDRGEAFAKAMAEFEVNTFKMAHADKRGTRSLRYVLDLHYANGFHDLSDEISTTTAWSAYDEAIPTSKE